MTNTTPVTPDGATAPVSAPTHAVVQWYPGADGFERAVVFEPGWNDHGGRYGVHGMRIQFLLRGPKGVTLFLMGTGWVPGDKGVDGRVADLFPFASDVGYHAHVPQYEGAMGGRSACEYLDGVPCFYDGSGLSAEPIMADFIRRGDVAVWEALREWHDGLTDQGA
jgi:hypothetical protein